jgi:hypothetical protein
LKPPKITAILFSFSKLTPSPKNSLLKKYIYIYRERERERIKRVVPNGHKLQSSRM